MLEGSVLLTGGTGFLGRAILRRASIEKWPCRFTVFSRDVMRQQQVWQRFPDLDLRLQPGDVRDYDQVERAMAGHDICLHLAAFKHIPQAEKSPSECIAINVDGTRHVIRAAIRARVRRVVGISTDKAARPINTYGLTKAMLEKLFQEADADSRGTEFVLARYGNVVGSTGSVVPIWRQQAAAGEPLTITDPTMTRFWIDADAAVDIVLRAYGMTHGACYIPKMPAMRIGDMARALFPDAKQRTIGLRPGEKRHEDLLQEQETYWATDWGDYYALWPTTAKPVRDKPLEPYASDVPSRWVKPEEFRAMVELGEQI